MMKETSTLFHSLVLLTGLTFGFITLLSPSVAHAYIGPGLSVGAAIVVLIVLFSIMLALYALVWFPLKRRMNAKREKDGGV